MKEKRVSVGKGRFKIGVTALITMDGVIVTILGGEKPHVGAVAIGSPRPSLEDPSEFSATTSVFTLVGHKDDEVARPAAEKLAGKLNQTVVVVAGVHVRKANDEDIKKLTCNSKQAVEILLRKLNRSAASVDFRKMHCLRAERAALSLY
jgi:hypothetical protein